MYKEQANKASEVVRSAKKDFERRLQITSTKTKSFFNT